MCDALHYLLDNIFIRFGSKLHRQIVGIPMGTNCAPLVKDLFILASFFRKKGILISCQSRSVVRLSLRASVTFLVNVSPPKPLEVATSNFVVE